MAKKEYDPTSGSEVEVKNKKIREKITERGYFDYGLLFVWIFIMLLGYVILFSASSYTAVVQGNSSTYYLVNQIKNTGIGLIPMIALTLLDYRLAKRYYKLVVYGAYIVSLLLVICVKIPGVGVTKNGASRWIRLGVEFQPAEIVKITVIIMTAYLLSKCSQSALKKWKLLIQIWMYTLVPTLMIFVLTSNLSSAILILGIGSIMIIVAANKRSLNLLSIIAIGGGYAALNFLGQFANLNFRFRRIAVWADPFNADSDDAMQVVQGLYAIGSGGLFGKGLGNSAQKLGYVPEATNDMIFSIVCEELGIFGAACIIVLFLFMLNRMRIVAGSASDFFGSMLVVGVMAQIALQFSLNIAVVTNFLPNTGISLPFISSGGTSLIFLMMEIGIVFSVSRRIKRIK